MPKTNICAPHSYICAAKYDSFCVGGYVFAYGYVISSALCPQKRRITGWEVLLLSGKLQYS